jgi:hypothetical protein
METTEVKRFDLGRVMITLNAFMKLRRNEVMETLGFHARGDFGATSNEKLEQMRLFLSWRLPVESVFHDGYSAPFNIITNEHRTETSVMLQEERAGAVGKPIVNIVNYPAERL